LQSDEVKEVTPPTGPLSERELFDPAELVNIWEQHMLQGDTFTESSPGSHQALTAAALRKTPNFVEQVLVFTQRCFIQSVRDLKGLLLEFGYMAIAGDARGDTLADRH
jgi:hypothetical protein